MLFYALVLIDAGDHALEWMVSYYIKSVRSRLRTQQQLREAILQQSLADGLSLATPTQLAISRNNTP